MTPTSQTEDDNAPWPIALYGVMLLFAGVAYFILTKRLSRIMAHLAR